MKAIALSVLACALLTIPAAAEEKTYGEWQVTIEKDRFGGNQATKTLALRMSEGNGLAIRCFPNGLSVVVGEMYQPRGRFEEGTEFYVKFRADQKPVVEARGVAINDKMIQIVESDKIISDMVGAKEFAFRFVFKGVYFDKVFPAGKGAKTVLEIVTKACAQNS